MTDEPADVVLVGGVIWTMGRAGREVTGVAIRDGVFTVVGTQQEALARADSSTRVVDMRGGTLLPGFQDAHVHPIAGGLRRIVCDMSEVHAKDAYLRLVHDWSRDHPRAEWIDGGGWYGDAFPGGLPTRQQLDVVAPDRPVFLRSHDGHTVWVNSVALKRAGIDRSTPDPPNGRILRDDRGDPTGVLVEEAAELVARLKPQPSADQLTTAMLEAQAYLHSLGITAWQDAIVGNYLGIPDTYEIYRRLESDGLLTARVVGALWWDLGQGVEQVPSLLQRREAARRGRFRATSIKIMQDGVCENCTGAMLAPYLDAAGDPVLGTGLSFIEPAALSEVVTKLDAEGFQLHFHGVGDRAVRECLDAVEHAAGQNGSSDRRHQIAHLDVVHPDDIPRFKSLDVIANCQPLWARLDDEIEQRKLPLLGADREPHHFPFRSLSESGAVLAMGSDWPVSSPDPLWGIHTAVQRTAPRGDHHAASHRARTVPLEAAQRLTAREAARAYTLGSAFANHLDDSTGSIEVGKHADLVVVDCGLDDPAAFEQARVLLTLVAGDAVHDVIQG